MYIDFAWKFAFVYTTIVVEIQFILVVIWSVLFFPHYLVLFIFKKKNVNSTQHKKRKKKHKNQNKRIFIHWPETKSCLWIVAILCVLHSKHEKQSKFQFFWLTQISNQIRIKNYARETFPINLKCSVGFFSLFLVTFWMNIAIALKLVFYWKSIDKCGVTTNMSSDITLAHIHGLLENFSKNVYRAKDSDQGTLVSITYCFSFVLFFSV